MKRHDSLGIFPYVCFDSFNFYPLLVQFPPIGLFFGSDTGNTEQITEELVSLWAFSDLEVINANHMTVEDYARFDIIFLGLSTWYDGELQSDFELFFDSFKTIDFSGKIVALYGLGDQLGYGEYFVDGIGILAEVVLNNGGTIIGKWPLAGYDFEASKAVCDDTMFYGLALDEDNEMHKTSDRLKTWVQQVKSELAAKLITV